MEHKREDQLGRLNFVDHCCDVLKLLPCERGAVMGIAAPWGTGKTWVLEAMRDKSGQADVWIDFNPWQFSGTDQFIEQLLNEIGQQFLITKVKKAIDKAKEIGESVLRYRQVIAKLKEHSGIIKVISPRLAGVLDYVPELDEGDSKDAEKKAEAAPKVSLRESKEKVVQLLSGISFKVVVAIDDLDRMPPHEVAAVIQAIKAVANFPNVIYVLAYDADVVGKALQTHLRIDDGRAYLEKIINYELVMPAPLEHQFLGALKEGVRKALSAEHMDVAGVDDSAWALPLDTCAALLTTPRDLERLVIRYQLAVRKLARSIDARDLLIAEALQLKHPDIIGAIAKVRRQLMMVSDPADSVTRPDEPEKEKVFGEVPGYKLPSVRRALQFLFAKMQVEGVSLPRPTDYQGLQEEALWIRWWQWAREEDWVSSNDLLKAVSTVGAFLSCPWFDNPQWLMDEFRRRLDGQDRERHLQAHGVMALAYAQADMGDRFQSVCKNAPMDPAPFLRHVLHHAPAESLATLLAFLVKCMPEGTVAELLGVGSEVVLDEGIQRGASRLLMDKIDLGIRSESPDLPVSRRFDLLAAMQKMKGRVLFEAWLNALHEDATQKPELHKAWAACVEHSGLALGDKAVVGFLSRFRVQD